MLVSGMLMSRTFWEEKLLRNRERDGEKHKQLQELGWNVIVIWECELKNNKIKETLDTLKEVLTKNIRSK